MDFKIKELPVKKIKNPMDYVRELSEEKIICFGFLINAYFYEFSFKDGIFYERCGKGKVEKNKEFEDRAQLEERITALYRRACYK